MIVEQEGEVEDEDLIQREDMVVTVSHLGYVKRVPLSTYRAQRRGGKGRSGMQTRDEDFVTRLFVASHAYADAVLLVARPASTSRRSGGCREAAPQARGKALINILPLEQGERITTIMPLPEDENTWAKLDVMFATTRGTVRRNKLSDFVDVRRSGMIAMKLDEGEAHRRRAASAPRRDDVLLTTALGQCIRFPVADVRVFTGRTSMGVRGIALGEGDKVISMAILRHFDATPEERAAYLKQSGAIRRAATGEEARAGGADGRGRGGRDGRRVADAGALCRNGRGRAVRADASPSSATASARRRSSSASPGAAARASARPTSPSSTRSAIWSRRSRSRMADQIMLVSDGGQLIRVPVDGIRMTSRASKGVRVFNTGADEKVVSVERIGEEGEGTNGDTTATGTLRATVPATLGRTADGYLAVAFRAIRSVDTR